MKPQSTISIAIATYNEEQFITTCLKAVNNWVDEIIVVDGDSTDNTVSLAKKFSNCKVIKTTNKPMFHLNKQMAIDACTSDWILQLDADEMVSNDLQKEIEVLLQKKASEVPENGFWLNRANFFMNRFLKKGGQYPDPTLRLYKKGLGKLPCLSVHEQAQVEGKVGHLKNDLLHYADLSISRYLQRSNRYTTLIAQDLKKGQQPLNMLSFITYFFIKPNVWFLKTYFRHLGCKDGFAGFAFSWFSSLRFPIAYIKYYELINKPKNLPTTHDWT